MQHVPGEVLWIKAAGQQQGADIQLRASLHRSLRRPFFMVRWVSYRAFCCAISDYLCQDCAPKHEHHWHLHAIVGAAHRQPWKILWRVTYLRRSEIRPRSTHALRRVLRVFWPRPHRLHTRTAEPLAVRIAKHSSIMNVQFLLAGGFVMRFLSPRENARCTPARLLCSDSRRVRRTWIPCGMNGDCIAEENCKWNLVNKLIWSRCWLIVPSQAYALGTWWTGKLQ